MAKIKIFLGLILVAFLAYAQNNDCIINTAKNGDILKIRADLKNSDPIRIQPINCPKDFDNTLILIWGDNPTLNAELAAQTTHEVSHQLDMPGYNYDKLLKDEERAYRIQSDINHVVNKESMWGLWNPSWEKVDAPILREKSIKMMAGESVKKLKKN